MTPILTNDRAVLLRGEALEALRAMPDDSVDALVTDPPAGISFMAKGWDSDKGGRDAWIAWLAEIMREALRVLKPGAHGLVWALPRTSHWTATALEDAGFEVRDVVMHLFGCVPLETEILTAEGWKLHSQLRVGEQVAQVDARGFVTFGPLQAVSVYPHEGDMLRISTRSTEQLLTAGHTVHAYAKRAKWRRTETDEDLTAMPADVFAQDQPGVCAWQLPLAARGAAPQHTLASPDVAALYGWVISEGHFHADVEAVSIYQNEGAKADEIRALLDRLGIERSEYRRTRDDYDGTPRDTVQWYIGVGEWSRRLRADLAGTKPTPTDSLAWLPVEQAIALFEALIAGDGSRSGPNSGAWYQKRPEVRAWFQALCFRLGIRTTENSDKSAVSWCVSDSTEVQRGKHKERWLSRVPFVGEVWCPTVASGRWVARYRGNVFVTGNTGFPKSLDVSKAIDAAAGVERMVTGTVARPKFRKGRGNGRTDGGGPIYLGINGGHDGTTEVEITAPGSPEAAKWQGWGTALKPAAEHWILVRKPLAGTVAANVLEHGTGALNIDACRIAHGTDVDLSQRQRQQTANGTVAFSAGMVGTDSATYKEGGRWPAHVTLDEEAAAMLDEQSGVSKGAAGTKCSNRGPDGKCRGHKNAGRSTSGETFHGADSASTPDTGGASRFFYVAKGSRSEKDLGCEHLPPRTAGEATDREEGSAGLKNPRAGAGRTGGARNHHPTVKSIALMRWLCRLITPPGGLILDCFVGSGSTGVAALAEGFTFVGVERDLDDETGEPLGYCEIAKARLVRALADNAKTADQSKED